VASLTYHPFVYRYDRRQVRISTLQPVWWDSRVECELHFVNLYEPTSYETLDCSSNPMLSRAAPRLLPLA